MNCKECKYSSNKLGSCKKYCMQDIEEIKRNERIKMCNIIIEKIEDTYPGLSIIGGPINRIIKMLEIIRDNL